MQFSLVIPTYNRPESLQATLQSILANTRLPTEVLLIDDGDLSSEFVAGVEKQFRDANISFVYYKKDHTKIRRGLSESKNLGAHLAKNEIVFFLDDDVKLDSRYCEELMGIWEQNSEDAKLMGVGGKISNNRKTGYLEKLFRLIFGLSSEYAWDVNDVGFQVWDEEVNSTEKAYYIHGGVSSYRREALKQCKFVTFSGGRTALEDVEQCLHAKRKGFYFFYAPSARLEHYPGLVRKESAFEHGQKETENRRVIFQKYCKQDLYHKAWFAWANLGWIIKKLIGFKFLQAFGMIKGILTS